MRTIFTLSSLLLVGMLAGQVQIKRTPIPATKASDGAEMYRTYCASCHGIDGKGSGPAAAALNEAMPDLTKLAQANEGPFPSESVMLTLGRIRGSGAHGSQEMPVWGDVFRATGMGADEMVVQLRIYNLMRHLEGMQDPPAMTMVKVKPPSPGRISDIRPSSGADMYAAYCSSCHGMQGLGDGPSASSLKNRPTDLTMLSANNRGAFPAANLNRLMDRDPGTAAHGSKEMPVWGDAFRATGESPALAQLRVHNIVAYVRSIQR